MTQRTAIHHIPTTLPLHGEILVGEIIDRDRLIRERWARNAEWYALKQWWAARAAVRRAKTTEKRQRAQVALQKTEHLYHEELQQVWPKWEAAQLVLGRTWVATDDDLP